MQNQSSSSISDASSVRYQKAVKQINKLIGINNTIKKDAENFRALCQNLQLQNTQLYQGLQSINNQKQALQRKIQQYQNKIKQLQSQNSKLLEKQSSLFTNSMLQNERSKHKQQINMLNEKLNQQGHTIIHLQQRVAGLQKENKDKGQMIQKLEEQKKRQIELRNKSISYGQCTRCPQNLKKMQQAIQFKAFLENEFVELKRRQIFQQSFQPVVMYNKNANAKENLILNLEQRVRIMSEKYKKKNIQVYKLQRKIEKIQDQLIQVKQKLRVDEATNKGGN